MDQINGWPKQLPCLCAMTGSCREQFRHFVLMSEVWSAVIFCKPTLNYANTVHSFSLSPFFFPHLLFFFFTNIVDLGQLSVKSSLLLETVFLTLILDNGSVTVVLALGLVCYFEASLVTHTLYPYPYNYRHSSVECYKQKAELYVNLKIHISVL